MVLIRKLKTTLSLLGSLGLALALWHCSPIAPSVSKSQLTTGGDQNSKGTSTTAPPFHSNSLVAYSFAAKVLDSSAYVDALSGLVEAADLQIVSLSESQLAELSQSRKTTLSLPAQKSPGLQASVFIEVSLRRASLERLGLNALEVSLSASATKEGTWQLAILPSADPEKAKQLELALSSIESVSVVVGKLPSTQKISPARPAEAAL